MIVRPSLLTGYLLLGSRYSFIAMVAMAATCSITYGMSLSNSFSNLQPFNLIAQQDSDSTIDVLLQMVNESNSPASILSWQLDLKLHPLDESRGAILFEHAIAPPESLFGEEPGPIADPPGTSAHVNLSDADHDDFSGVQLEPLEIRNAVALEIAAGPDCHGDFELVARAYDANAPDLGSSWFPTEASEPQPFANATASSLPGYMLLGTIRIQSTIEPGDYNQDQKVDELDYQQWRLAFGTNVASPYIGSDGNGDSMVDAADYVIWRSSATGSMGALNAGEPVPESPLTPHCEAFLALLLTSLLNNYRTHRSLD